MANDQPQHDDDDDARNSSKDEAQTLKDGVVDGDEVDAEADADSDSDADADVDEDAEDAETEQKKPRKIHKLSMTTTQNFNEKLRKRGVLYVARIPPRMSPTKLKSLLGQFGPIVRVYLVPEDQTARKRRKKAGGSGSKRYTEGWVEFESKKTAKHVANSLNNTVIANRKHDPHYGDLWNLKYLPKFQWAHLTEKVAYERRVREQKLRMETMQARRETVAYKHAVETGKKIDKIAERKRKRGETLSDIKDKREAFHTRQNRPVDDGAVKPAKRALLKSLV
jgi:ESF2/ABP1 family protein